jgi:hypothetical protein
MKMNQDAAFYTDGQGLQTVWHIAGGRFSVIRSGEMRIQARHTLEEEFTVIRYTDRLESFGVKNDADLEAWTNKGEEFFTWDNNSWFEIEDSEDAEYYSDVIDTLDDAVEYAKELNANPALLEEEVKF